MELRNPAYNVNGGIDVEYNHPSFGWIPFSAQSEDFEPLGQEIYALALTMSPAPYVTPVIPITSDSVNAERDRREALGCKVNMGANRIIPLEGNEKSMRNLQGLAFAASLRLGQGDTTSITTFRDALNVDHLLTPGQIVFLWSQGAAYISALYSACWALKAFDPIPANFADNSYWPAYE